MDSQFVPMFSGAAKTAPTAQVSRLKLTSPTETVQPFQPAVAVPVASSPAHECQPSAKPVVTLKRDGDKVTHISIQCPCGQVIELECSY